MSSRITFGLVALAAAGLWLVIFQQRSKGSVPTATDELEFKSSPVPITPALLANTAPPPAASSKPPPNSAVRAQPLSPSQENDNGAAESPPPNPTEDEVPYELRAAAEEEQHMANMTRSFAESKIRRHLKSEPRDSTRTSQVIEQYEDFLDETHLSVEHEVECTAKICEVTIETGDPEVIAQFERFHHEHGQTPMTMIDGDPTIGSIDRMRYYLLDDELLHDMVGANTIGVFAPGRTE